MSYYLGISQFTTQIVAKVNVKIWQAIQRILKDPQHFFYLDSTQKFSLKFLK